MEETSHLYIEIRSKFWFCFNKRDLNEDLSFDGRKLEASGAIIVIDKLEEKRLYDYDLQ